MKKLACLVLIVCTAAGLCGCSKLGAIFGGGGDKAETDTNDTRTASVISAIESIPLPVGGTAVVESSSATANTVSETASATSSKPYELIKPQSVSEAQTVTVDADGGLNLRYGPGTSYGQIALIPNGAKITRTAQQNGWSYVSYSGKSGWVSSEFVK